MSGSRSSGEERSSGLMVRSDVCDSAVRSATFSNSVWLQPFRCRSVRAATRALLDQWSWMLGSCSCAVACAFGALLHLALQLAFCAALGWWSVPSPVLLAAGYGNAPGLTATPDAPGGDGRTVEGLAAEVSRGCHGLERRFDRRQFSACAVAAAARRSGGNGMNSPPAVRVRIDVGLSPWGVRAQAAVRVARGRRRADERGRCGRVRAPASAVALRSGASKGVPTKEPLSHSQRCSTCTADGGSRTRGRARRCRAWPVRSRRSRRWRPIPARTCSRVAQPGHSRPRGRRRAVVLACGCRRGGRTMKRVLTDAIHALNYESRPWRQSPASEHGRRHSRLGRTPCAPASGGTPGWSRTNPVHRRGFHSFSLVSERGSPPQVPAA